MGAAIAAGNGEGGSGGEVCLPWQRKQATRSTATSRAEAAKGAEGAATSSRE